MQHYCHAATGLVAIPTKDVNFYQIQGMNDTLIPIALITQSDEWDVVKRKKLFTSEDGVDICEGDYWTYVTISKMPKVGRTNTLVYNGDPRNVVETKRFADGNTAQQFARLLRQSITYFELESLSSELKISKTTLSLIKKRFIK